jgi:hypothetical protein
MIPEKYFIMPNGVSLEEIEEVHAMVSNQYW